MEAQRATSTRGIIYAIGVVGTSLIKIGRTSTTVEKRLQTLQTGHPLPLQILATVAVETDIRRIEAQIHTFLAAKRCHGEWFDTPMDLVQLQGLVGQARQVLAAKDAVYARWQQEGRRHQGHMPTAEWTLGQRIGKRVQHCRKTRKMTQEQLAAVSRVPQGTISRLESGKADDPQISTLRALAVILDMSLDDLADMPTVVGKAQD